MTQVFALPLGVESELATRQESLERHTPGRSAIDRSVAEQTEAEARRAPSSVLEEWETKRFTLRLLAAGTLGLSEH